MEATQPEGGAAMSTLLIKNARYIVSCDDQDSLHERCNLFIRD